MVNSLSLKTKMRLKMIYGYIEEEMYSEFESMSEALELEAFEKQLPISFWSGRLVRRRFTKKTKRVLPALRRRKTTNNEWAMLFAKQ